MSFPPPEPTPENSATCPCCGEPISIEGLQFMADTADPVEIAIKASSAIAGERFARDIDHAIIYGTFPEPVGPAGEEGPHGPLDLPGPAGPE